MSLGTSIGESASPGAVRAGRLARTVTLCTRAPRALQEVFLLRRDLIAAASEDRFEAEGMFLTAIWILAGGLPASAGKLSEEAPGGALEDFRCILKVIYALYTSDDMY